MRAKNARRAPAVPRLKLRSRAEPFSKEEAAAKGIVLLESGDESAVAELDQEASESAGMASQGVSEGSKAEEGSTPSTQAELQAEQQQQAAQEAPVVEQVAVHLRSGRVPRVWHNGRLVPAH